MNSNLQTLQSLVQSQRSRAAGAPNAGGGSPGDALAVAQGGPQAGKASFATWMSQMQEARMPQGNAEAAAKAATPSRADAARAQAAQRQAPAQAQQARLAADKADAAAAERNRQAQRAAQPKPASSQAAKPKDGADAPDKSTSATSEETAKAETSTACQGEAAATGRESQTPQEVPASDPAAMLAWLAHLTQADPAVPAETASDAATVPGQGDADEASGPALLPRGSDHRGGGAGLLDTAAASTKALAQSAGAGDAAAADAALVDGLATQDAPLEFSALMARELGRPAGPAAQGAEGARHVSGSLSTPVDSPDFQQALADRVRLWVSGPATEGPMTAELRLNPAEMGPIQIRIQLDGQAAQVDFAAAHAETREAIEASMPALSSALEEAGLRLSGGGVSDQASQQQAWAGRESFQDQAPGWRAADGAGGDTDADVAALPGAAAPPRPASRPGGLDLYA